MAHEGLWEQLVKLDKQKTAQRANCRYLTETNQYNITFLNTDYIVDLGPEGGAKGGQVIGQCSPEELLKVKKSYTGQYLRKVLKEK